MKCLYLNPLHIEMSEIENLSQKFSMRLEGGGVKWKISLQVQVKWKEILTFRSSTWWNVLRNCFEMMKNLTSSSSSARRHTQVGIQQEDIFKLEFSKTTYLYLDPLHDETSEMKELVSKMLYRQRGITWKIRLQIRVEREGILPSNPTACEISYIEVASRIFRGRRGWWGCGSNEESYYKSNFK